jgi:hypothetical protein
MLGVLRMELNDGILCVIFTHISQHARLEIPWDDNDRQKRRVRALLLFLEFGDLNAGQEG